MYNFFKISKPTLYYYFKMRVQFSVGHWRDFSWRLKVVRATMISCCNKERIRRRKKKNRER